VNHLADLKEKLKSKMIPPLAYNLIKYTNQSYRLQVEGWEAVERELSQGESLVFSSWHGKSWVPAYFLRNLGIYALTSLSRDGSYMTEILHRLGWQTVRGSSSRGASRSLLTLYRKLRAGGSTALTPDGPTGPIYEVKPGVIFLQEKAGSMLVPMGVDACWKKNFASWDHYLLPLPFSRTALVFGKPFIFENDLEMEVKKEILKEKMEAVNLRAAEIVKK
jgi:lysophospholipid acyltransferase (LPLAT)-like uncharacterized protein